MGIFSRKRKPPAGLNQELGSRVGLYGGDVGAQSPTPAYLYQQGHLIPRAGADAFALVTQWLAWRPMLGPGFIPDNQFRVLNNIIPVMQPTGLATQGGLGGLASGTIVLQPLSDPYNA